MIENINLLGTFLEQYVQTFYHATNAQVGSAPTVYQDRIYIGLQNYPLFQEQIVAAGILRTLQTNWGTLTWGDECND